LKAIVIEKSGKEIVDWWIRLRFLSKNLIEIQPDSEEIIRGLMIKERR
jgi:hypothetical protein